MPLLVLFIAMPILEMWLLIEVGSRIGSLVTIGLVALTAIIGASLLRRQGVSTLTRAQERLNSGELPAMEILEGLFLAIGGALLLTPGFVTDAVGFACLLPPVRQAMVRRLLDSGLIRAQQDFVHRGGPGVYEGEFSRESDPVEPNSPEDTKNLPPGS